MSTKLYVKSQNENTIVEEREGKKFNAQMTSPADSLRPRAEAVGISSAFGNGVSAPKPGQSVILDSAKIVEGIANPVMAGSVPLGEYDNGYNVPLRSLGGKSFNEAKRAGLIKMEGNSLNTSWANFMEATRIDLSIKKNAKAVLRDLVYNIRNTPNATRLMNPQETLPPAMVFEENNGTGESINMGEAVGFTQDTMLQKLYAVGWTQDLLATLFDSLYSDGDINEGVAVGESALKDELAFAPIFAHSYAAAAQSPAYVDTDMKRHELLYNTLSDAIDKFAVRKDPITDRELGSDGLVLIANPNNARHCAQVAGGAFPQVGNVTPYGELSSISRILGYEAETIVGVNTTKSYTACPSTKAYLVKPNRKMIIAVKRSLQLDTSMDPDPTTLAQAIKAWWFCEAIYNAGISEYVQEITLPDWNA